MCVCAQASVRKACHILKLRLLLHVLITLFRSLLRSPSLSLSLPLALSLCSAETLLINIQRCFYACRRLHPDVFEGDLPSARAAISLRLRLMQQARACYV